MNTGVSQILKGADRARDLVQQILTFSRQAASEKHGIKLYLIVKEAAKFIRSTIPASIDIKEHMDTHKSIYADATQMHQVVTNLCTNAYHAMKDKGGCLDITLYDDQVSYEDQIKGHKFVPGDYLVLKITDTGHGMSQHTMDKIFEPYFTTKKAGEGTGLGLAVVQGIVKAHHGHIMVDSKMGEGTCFSLYFPVFDKSTADVNATQQVPRIPVETEHQGKILVADDESSIRVFMQATFEEYGYHVEVFPNGEAALERFKEDPFYFDLVITDVAMPKMSGDRLAEQILKIRNNMPIIVHTGYSETFDEQTASALGVHRYFQKPVDGKVLLLAVQDLLASLK